MKVETEAQHQAIDRFRGKAADIAKNFGMNSYSLREVAVSAGDQGYKRRQTVTTSVRDPDSSDCLPLQI